MTAASPPSVSKNSRPLAFFGAAEFSAPSLKALINNGFAPEVVITKPDRRAGRGQHRSEPLVKQIAASAGIPVLQPATKTELTAALEKVTSDTGVVVAYGMILPDTTLEHFSGGLINVHASLLPHWRGPSPIEAALAAGDEQIGVSIMQIAARMDSGPVYGFAQTAAPASLDRLTAYPLLANLGAETLTGLLPGILDGSINPITQDDDAATYCHLLNKDDGRIDWQQPAPDIERRIRAYLGWPGSAAKLGGYEVTITKARIDRATRHMPHAVHDAKPGDVFITDSKHLAAVCGNNSTLLIQRLKPAGKPEINGRDFINGYLR